MERQLKILLAASEVHPYAKTGGLADVAGTLPLALKKKNQDVRVIMPKYRCASEGNRKIQPLNLEMDIPVGPKKRKGVLFQGSLSGQVPLYLVGNDSYYDREGIYGTGGTDFPDTAERFIFFCRAVLEACKALSFFPDILHVNDWHTGLIPVYLKTEYARDPRFEATRTVFSIHNLAFQGNFGTAALDLARLPQHLFTADGLEFYGQLSFMKAGLVYADLLNTVSPTYSREIRTAETGCGMDGILRRRAGDLHGILNGVDYDEWNPESDPSIAARFSPGKMKGKQDCRRDLSQSFSLAVDDRTPILGMVTRLTDQKGVDLIMNSVERILDLGAALVLLGTGDPKRENFFRKLGRAHKGRLGIRIGYDEALAHRIVAGSDLFLVPSKYEPCGLTQMFALKYGTAPLVRAVGGLNDTVKEFQPKSGKGTGFKFRKYEEKYLLQSVRKALSCYRTPSAWRQLMQNAMAEDFGWERAAGKYLRMYRQALQPP